MFSTSSWSSRLVLVLLALPLASACKPDPTPPPSGNPDTTPPSTRANPVGGNFTASLTVTLTCEDGTGSGCAATFFTTDGTAPSASSTRYTSPVAVARNTTLKFFSVDAAGNVETAQTQSYVVDTVPPLTVASPEGGIINSARTVALLCTDTDGLGTGCAATYYTTDGTAPTTGSPRYTAPLLVSASTTLRFFSVDGVGNTEGAKMAQYTLDATAPTVVASPAAGNYNTPQTVTLSCDDGLGTGCGPIRYTTNGTLPSSNSPAYSAPLLVSANTTLRFFATDGAGNTSPIVSAVYVIDETGPTTTATPPGGISNTPVSVVLACDDGTGTGCAGTYYTTDGSPPTTGSARYTTALSITSSTTLKFFSVDTLGNPGPTGTAQYTLDFTAPITTANPPGGTYSGERTVVLECKDGTGAGCAATYYTLDGTTPTHGSSRYTTALSITANTTLRFFSVDKANNTESVRTEEYDLDSVAPGTRATPAGGIYKSNQSVVLSCDDGVGSGCVETHYTVDGSMPTMASAKYTSALVLTGNTPLRFFSVDLAGNQEAVQTETYTIDTVAPSTTATPAAGTYGSTVSVTLACDDGASGSGCAETHYTVDGSAPALSSPLYSGALSLTATTTLRYFSTDKAGNKEPTRVALYTLDQVAPTVSASPRGGLFNKAQSITLTCSDTGGSSCAAIHYTTDGTVPTTASATYSAPLTVSATTPLKFLATDKVGNASDVQTELYRLDDVAPTTTATPPGGPYADSQSVTLLCTDGAGSGCAATYYTLDGSTPTSSSSTYSAPFTLTATTSLKFFSVDAAGNAEPVKTVTYVIDRDKPTVAAAPPGGTYRTAQSVTLTCSDTGGSTCASIHYTLDGSTPTLSSLTYSAPLTIATSTTLKFLAADKVGNVSGVSTESYVLDTVAPVTTAVRAGGAYGSAQSVTLLCADGSGSGCSATYYTLDGSLPTTGSPRYTAPFSITANATLRFFSVDTAGNAESPRTETYLIDTESPTVSADPASGTYNSAQSVTLSCTDNTGGSGCAAIHYTTDGSSPTMDSPLYTEPIAVSTSTALAFFAVDTVGNVSATQYAWYFLDMVAPYTGVYPPGGTYNGTVYVYLYCSDDTGSGCAAIHYTTDGSTPTTSSPVTSGYISLTATTTLKFFSVDVAGNAEPVHTEAYVIIPDTTPPFTYASPAGGTYSSGQYVYLYCADNTWCANTYYTLDGSEPTTASTPYYGSYLYISSDTTLKFFSVDGSGNA
ncbi:chitobiase/beta-hexosaminidase C-terminal domain-containing protein, partial [Archangium sp.]|uniref:chitobiase/beta-hexosaminidase C-terminal domain-containing protein n=1 Tax=Archangium sp. TaxID=1872627 RepID=UPI00389A3F4F